MIFAIILSFLTFIISYNTDGSFNDYYIFILIIPILFLIVIVLVTLIMGLN